MKKLPNHPDPVPVVAPRCRIGCGASQYAYNIMLPKAIVVSGIATHGKAEVFVQKQVKSTTTDDFTF